MKFKEREYLSNEKDNIYEILQVSVMVQIAFEAPFQFIILTIQMKKTKTIFM